MNDSLSQITKLDPQSLDIIRTETALSRYPIHRLANKGTVNIEIRRKDEKGATSFLWEVSHNSRYGQPGPLAYKLDTLVINRKLDESQKPTPKVLRLGSLHEIAQELNLGSDTNIIKRALRQNASAFITAKTTYKGIDGAVRSFEFSDTRYGVVFTGEVMPDGRKADAVYLVFHDLYLTVLNMAIKRPLDYDYLRELAPGPQRFYEIVSYEMLPAVRYNQRAKLPYSEFCMYSTMTRYETYEQVKKQMYKIHQPHIKAKYIAKVEFEPTTDEEGRPDWNMFYVPGELARFQQLAFAFEIPYTPRKRDKGEKATATTLNQVTAKPQTSLLLASEIAPEVSKAQTLVKTFYRLRYGQLQEATPREVEQATELLAEGEAWANYLVDAAAKQGKEPNGFPENFGGVGRLAVKFKGDFEAERKKQEAAQQTKARQSHVKAHTSEYLAFLRELVGGKLEEALPEAYRAFTQEEEKTLQFHKSRAIKSDLSADVVAKYYETEIRVDRLLEFIKRNPKSGVPNFWQWDAKFNPSPFSEAVEKKDRHV